MHRDVWISWRVDPDTAGNTTLITVVGNGRFARVAPISPAAAPPVAGDRAETPTSRAQLNYMVLPLPVGLHLAGRLDMADAACWQTAPPIACLTDWHILGMRSAKPS